MICLFKVCIEEREGEREREFYSKISSRFPCLFLDACLKEKREEEMGDQREKGEGSSWTG